MALGGACNIPGCGQSADSQPNGIPDECEDCNNNGVLDPADIAAGTSADCNGNGIPDECDIAAGTSVDANMNQIPDECEFNSGRRTATIFVYDDQGDPVANPFELGNLTVFAVAADLGLSERDVIDALVLSDITPGGVTPAPNGVMDPGADEVLFSLAPGSPALLGPDGAPGQAGVDDDQDGVIDDPGETGFGDDLSPADIFTSTFDGVRSVFISHLDLGLLPTDNVDAVDIGPTLTIVDCNCNGVEDACDIARGFSNDCNGNNEPDECERQNNDCNCNDTPDECDIDPTDPDGNGQVSPNCNGNLIPDECELAECLPEEPSCQDCNANGVLDECDIANCPPGDLTCQDCLPNGIPDGCEADCDSDGITDECEIANCLPGDPSCQDCQPNSIPDVCDIAQCLPGDLSCQDCNANGVPDGCDIDDGTSFDCNINDVPDECECLPVDAPTTPAEEPVFAKNRYLSADAGNTGCKVALRVTLTDLPAPHDVLNGTTMWLGEPQEVCENAGQDVPPPAGCGPAPGLPSLTLWAATLQCEPFFTNWGALGTVHVYHEGVVPSAMIGVMLVPAVYDIQAIGEGCDIAAEANYSAKLTIGTSKWGDVVSDCATTPCGPPDGNVNILDVLAIVDKFINAAGAIIKVRADLQPATPDRIINILDVLFGVDALLGLDYPFPSPPPPCP